MRIVIDDYILHVDQILQVHPKLLTPEGSLLGPQIFMSVVAERFYVWDRVPSLSFSCWMKKGMGCRRARRFASSQLKVEEKENLLSLMFKLQIIINPRSLELQFMADQTFPVSVALFGYKSDIVFALRSILGDWH